MVLRQEMAVAWIAECGEQFVEAEMSKTLQYEG